MPIAAATVSPGRAETWTEYTVGTNAPGVIGGGSSRSSASCGSTLLMRIRLRLPTRAASSALSKAFSSVSPSAAPAEAQTALGMWGEGVCNAYTSRHAGVEDGARGPAQGNRKHHPKAAPPTRAPDGGRWQIRVFQPTPENGVRLRLWPPCMKAVATPGA